MSETEENTENMSAPEVAPASPEVDLPAAADATSGVEQVFSPDPDDLMEEPAAEQAAE